MVQEVLGLCEAQSGTETDELLQKTLKRIQVLEDGSIPAKEATSWKIEGQRRRITRKEYQRLLNKFEMEGFMAQKRIVESRKKQSTARQRCPV